MEKKKPNDLSPDQCLAVDTESLCKLLDCGRHTAVQIGDLFKCFSLVPGLSQSGHGML